MILTKNNIQGIIGMIEACTGFHELSDSGEHVKIEMSKVTAAGKPLEDKSTWIVVSPTKARVILSELTDVLENVLRLKQPRMKH